MTHEAILLPGSVLPGELAYAALTEALAGRASVRTKELELYRGDEPPPGYGLEQEVDGLLDEAARAGFGRFHLAGYSAGGAVAVAFAARHPERLLSLSLLEPAWIGDQGLSEQEAQLRAELRALIELPDAEMFARFVRAQLAPGVEPPPPPPGPPPPWMATRPHGIRAVARSFDEYRLDAGALGSLRAPVLYVLGGRSNPDLYGSGAERAAQLFADFRLEVFAERHHFDPPHRADPAEMAKLLLDHWDRAAAKDA